MDKSKFILLSGIAAAILTGWILAAQAEAPLSVSCGEAVTTTTAVSSTCRTIIASLQ